MAVFSGACVIPPPLEIEGSDAGVNSPPIVVKAADPFLFPGPIVVERGDLRRVILDFDDADVGDTLFVRFFRDYDPSGSTPPSADGQVAVSGQVRRVRDFTTSTWCLGVDDDDTDVHALDIVVADRDFLDVFDPDDPENPPFQAVPPGAGRSIRTWLMRCGSPN